MNEYVSCDKCNIKSLYLSVFHIALFLAKLVDWLIRILSLGAGSTWPGEIALRIDPLFVRHMTARISLHYILIVGTNGKTTTAALIAHGLKKMGKQTVRNPEGANLLNGVASTLVKNSSFAGMVSADYAIFELDENAFSQVIEQIQNPDAVLFLNLFRDQLDRYGEVHTIATRWQQALSTLKDSQTTLIINGDDPRLVYMGKRTSLPTVYFGAAKEDKTPKDVPHDVDSVHCPACGSKLIYFAMSYSHLGDYACRQCGFSAPERWTDAVAPVAGLVGMYNRYNIRAAISALHVMYKIDYNEARLLLDGFSPAFGRQESITALGVKWLIILSKNPAGFNQSVAALGEILKGEKTDIAIILNDRIPDGTDVSWIWDVEFEKVYQHAKTVMVSGDRTYDMAIRMETADEMQKENKTTLSAEPNLKRALSVLAKNHTGESPIVVLATYTGMLEVRKQLKGKALL